MPRNNTYTRTRLNINGTKKTKKVKTIYDSFKTKKK